MPNTTPHALDEMLDAFAQAAIDDREATHYNAPASIVREAEGRLADTRDALRAALASARAREECERCREHEEREAACCPEDVGFDEYIAVLQRRIADLEAASARPQGAEGDEDVRGDAERWRELASWLSLSPGGGMSLCVQAWLPGQRFQHTLAAAVDSLIADRAALADAARPTATPDGPDA